MLKIHLKTASTVYRLIFIFSIFPFIFGFQLLFFYTLNRPILSGHYSMFMLPFYILPWTLLAANLMKMILKRSEPFVILAVIVLLFMNRENMLNQEKDPWTFSRTKAGLVKLCDKYPSFRTIENGPFAGYQPEYEKVLEFIVNRYISGCTPYGDSGILLYPQRRGDLPETIDREGKTLIRIETFSPNIGVYSAPQ